MTNQYSIWVHFCADKIFFSPRIFTYRTNEYLYQTNFLDMIKQQFEWDYFFIAVTQFLFYLYSFITNQDMHASFWINYYSSVTSSISGVFLFIYFSIYGQCYANYVLTLLDDMDIVRKKNRYIHKIYLIYFIVLKLLSHLNIKHS